VRSALDDNWRAEPAKSKHRATERALHHAEGNGAAMSEQDRPPLFGTWRKAYAFTVVLFAVEVALLYAFTLRFS
jgi:hypothetical protein